MSTTVNEQRTMKLAVGVNGRLQKSVSAVETEHEVWKSKGELWRYWGLDRGDSEPGGTSWTNLCASGET